MKLVAFTGRKGSGKDTAAQVLIEAGYENVKFAGALKAMMYAFADYVGLPADESVLLVEGAWKEKTHPALLGKSFRYAMQTLGTEWGRDLIGDNLWIQSFIGRAHMFPLVVCTDARFPNEVATIKAMGGTVVRVLDPTFAPPANEHPSEALIDTLEVDHTIANNKALNTIESLHDVVRHLFL